MDHELLQIEGEQGDGERERGKQRRDNKLLQGCEWDFLLSETCNIARLVAKTQNNTAFEPVIGGK